MTKLKLISCSWVLALAVFSPPAIAQYMYLDANSDGINTVDDQLNASGPTTITVYLDTTHDRDGSAQSCNSHTSPPGLGTGVDFFSYDLILRVGNGNGTVSWGAYADSVGFTPMGGDVANSTDYKTTRTRASGPLAPGVYKLGQISVTVLSGAPSLEIGTSSSLDPSYFTGLGTDCAGSEYMNSYLLGTDWFDVDGVSPPNLPPSISAPTLVRAEEGSDVTIVADAIDSLSQTAPSISAQGYPTGLVLDVTPMGTNASRATLRGHVGTSDAGNHTIRWTAIDQGGLATNATTVMNVSSQSQASCAAITGYVADLGPGPVTVTEETSGLSATIGPWGGTLYSNGPCGEPMAFPVTSYTNRLTVGIDVGCGGKVGFTYRLTQTGTPNGNQESMTILLRDANLNTKALLWQWGNPTFCYSSSVWQSSRIAMIANLNAYANQHVDLVFLVSGNTNFGTQTQARIQSLAITDCATPSLAPLIPEDQLLEDHPWDEAHLAPSMQTKLNNFRNAVRAAGGIFDTTVGSAYRTLGYQLHLFDVWSTYWTLKRKPTVACQFLWATIQDEMENKHHIAYQPGRADLPGAIQHTKGEAFDAKVTLPPGLDQDTMAALYGLHRPYKVRTRLGVDRTHFEEIP